MTTTRGTAMDENVTHVFQPTVTMRRNARGWTVELDFSASYSHTTDETPGHVQQYEGGPEADRAAHDLQVWLDDYAETLLQIEATDNLSKPLLVSRILA